MPKTPLAHSFTALLVLQVGCAADEPFASTDVCAANATTEAVDGGTLFAGARVDSWFPGFSAAEATGEAPDGALVGVTVAFTPSEAPRLVTVPADLEVCADAYPRLRAAGTWSVRLGDRPAVTWEGTATLGPDAAEIGGSHAGPDVLLADDQADLHGLITVRVSRGVDAIVTTEGTAELLAVEEEAEARVRTVATWE